MEEVKRAIILYCKKVGSLTRKVEQLVVMTLGNFEVEEEKLLKIEIKLLLSLLLGIGRKAVLENGIGPLRAMKNKIK